MKRYPVIWAPAAQGDLHDIVLYIAERDPINADKVAARLQAKAETLAVMPERGRRIPELVRLGIQDFREVIERPWRICYIIMDRRVEVLAVLDGRRELEPVLMSRFLG